MITEFYGNMDNDKYRELLSTSKGEEEQTKNFFTLMCMNSAQIRFRVQENFYDKRGRTYHLPELQGRKLWLRIQTEIYMYRSINKV